MELAYSLKADPAKTACGMARDLNISFKHAVEVCSAVKGMDVNEAVSFLESVTRLEMPVPFKKYPGGVGHRKGVSLPGKYPKKTALEVINLLNNIKSNAEYKGLDSENLIIKHIQALKGISRLKRKPKGRWKPWSMQFVTIQAVAEEVEAKEKPAKKKSKEKPLEKPKEKPTVKKEFIEKKPEAKKAEEEPGKKPEPGDKPEPVEKEAKSKPKPETSKARVKDKSVKKKSIKKRVQ